MADVFAGVELGGTKCICILGSGPGDIQERIRVPTTTPDETLGAIRQVLAGWAFDALGIGSFGPLDLDPGSPSYGSIVNTPKAGWNDVDLLHLAGGRPVAIDTDVNGAALAEGAWGAAQGLASWAYVTVGTGVGVGSIVAGRPVRGAGHSEAGHMRVPRVGHDDFAGSCPYHGDCVEGLASGSAIAARGKDDWEAVAQVLAGLCHNLVLTAVPQRILIGGGVALGEPQLLPMVKRRLADSLGGYGATRTLDLAGDFLRPPALGNDAGPLGTLYLAGQAETDTSGR